MKSKERKFYFRKMNINLTNCRSCFSVIKITFLVILLDDIIDERAGNITFVLESIKLSNILDTQF
jgi:hypothetical protein